jgi:hypothetical protein
MDKTEKRLQGNRMSASDEGAAMERFTSYDQIDQQHQRLTKTGKDRNQTGF